MNAVVVIAVGAGVAVMLWVLAKLGRALASIVETLAALAFLGFAFWTVVRALGWLVRQIVTRWRTCLTLVALAAWLRWWGWLSLTVVLVTLALIAVVWHQLDVVGFDRWCGRWLRAWWLRWAVYGRKLPDWLHACGLTVRDEAIPVDVTVNLVSRRRKRQAVTQARQKSGVAVPALVRVRSGASWDEVRVRLVPGQTPEDFDEAARALATARRVSRVQVREIAPDVVSLDFMRRDLLTTPVRCRELPGLEPARVNLRAVYAGTTEYGTPWRLPLTGAGAHILVAGASGAGKNSVMWCPLVSAASAIRSGLVRVSGVDPKGMELAYGRGIFARYAVSGKDTLELLEGLRDELEHRKREFAGNTRDVPLSQEFPLELLEFDEIGALTRYTDRKTREAIVEHVAVLNTQGRALGVSVRGYVQEPTKDTVPVRELFTRRVCLRVTSKTHVGMVLGDGAYERGAWANRIPETMPGTGYVWGEGIREPLRVRAGWVSDETVKALEQYVTNGGTHHLDHAQTEDRRAA
ncbi:cell division protein FtsK [Amycolatopsis rubida]|uniref:Cell division protein FtsK n=1 Tax=Amycolatopsis rubida TaxID=112413 RepID=A0ABX0C2Z1_9PSEU|nr:MULTISPECIES: FtsK/SpoIIIE domain-containing protein [Amycolatopsis]MYW94304.1 cell division protein FtsK [Amycolatopsis rubida]NEC59293.1 cell division protein FtsK [Amycolatopsis rubida]OAP23170.1 DNA translocase FtsK [Amycolatopsis sp. M39]